MALDDKIVAWRSSRLHRKCKFCKYLRYVSPPTGATFCECAAKGKIIRDLLPDRTKAVRPLCGCFELDDEVEV